MNKNRLKAMLMILDHDIEDLCDDIEGRLVSMCWNKPELLKLINEVRELRKYEKPKPENTIHW